MRGRERGANDYSPLQFAVGFSILLRRTYGRIEVNEWMVQGLNGLSPLGCGLLGFGEAGFFRPPEGGLSALRRRAYSIVVSARPGWVRNYLAYFSCTRHAVCAPARGLGQSRGHQ